MIKSVILASTALFLAGFLFNGCENFLNGAELKDQIQTKIDYASADEVSIMISPSESIHGTTYPNATNQYKVSDVFTVRFTAASNYYFVKWIAKDARSGEEVKDVVRIKSPEQLETEVQVVKKGNDIQICPVVAERPNVSDFYPSISETGVPRDSSISIAFNKNLAEDNDLSGITVSCNGIDVTSSFKAPVLNGNIIEIAADKSNLISVEQGKIKTLTVTLPDNLFYVEYGLKVNLNANGSFTYKINSTTNDKAEITVGTVSGIISPISGTYNYNIGDVIDLKFEPDSEYNFSGWNIKDSDGNPVSPSVLLVEDIDSLSTKITVLEKISGVTVTPKTAKVPKIMDYEPKYSPNGKSYITPIKITFNTAMKAEDLNGTFENIEIKDGQKDLTDYFNLPELSQDGKVLTIRPRYDYALSSYFYEKCDISVSIANTIKDADDTLIEKSFDWIYRVNNIIEGTDPLIEELKVAKTENDLGNVYKLWDTDFSNSSWFSGNRTKGKFWIYLEVSDEETDIDEIIISDKLIRNVEGNSITPIEGNSTTITDFELTGVENKKYVKLEYDVGSNYPQDGLVQITIDVYDYDDHSTNTSFCVIKETNADGFNCYIETYYPSTTHPDYRGVEDKLKGIDGTKYYKSDLETAKTKLLIHPGEEKYYGSSKLYGKELEWKLYYSQTENVWTDSACIDISFKDGEYSYKDTAIVELPDGAVADKTKETYLKLSVTDDIGNVGDYYYNLPALPEKTFASVYGIQESTYVDNVLSCATSYTSDYISDSTKAYYGFVIYVKDLDQEEDVFTAYSFVSNVPKYSGLYNWLTNDAPLRNTEYYIQSVFKYKSTGWVTNFGPISELKIAKVADSPAEPLAIADENVTITKNEKDTQHVRIFIPEATASKYENIYLKSYSGWSISTPTSCVVPYYSKTQTIEFDVPTKYFWGQGSNEHKRIDQTFEIDYSNGNTATYTYPADNLIEDNVAPTRRGSITDVSYHYSGNYIPLYMPSDDGDGMAEEFDFTAYYMKWDNIWDLGLPDETYVKKNFSTKTAKGYGKETYVYVPFGHLTKDTYAVFVEIPDKNGNKGFFYIGKHNRYSNQLKSQLFNYNPWKMYSREKVIFLSTWWQSFESYQDYEFSFEAYYNNKWNTHYEDGTSAHVYKENPTDKQSASYISSYGKPVVPYKSNGDEDDTFLKIYVNYHKKSRTAPFYVYSKRNKMCSNITKEKNPETSYASAYNVPVKLADMLDCISSVEVYSDEPVLIHTLYNLENLGDDIDEWESYTPYEQELKVEIFRPTIDSAAEGYSEATDYTKNPYVYKIPRVDVPVGYYYCTVVHYADGSAKMTQVHYK